MVGSRSSIACWVKAWHQEGPPTLYDGIRSPARAAFEQATRPSTPVNCLRTRVLRFSAADPPIAMAAWRKTQHWPLTTSAPGHRQPLPRRDPSDAKAFTEPVPIWRQGLRPCRGAPSFYDDAINSIGRSAGRECPQELRATSYQRRCRCCTGGVAPADCSAGGFEPVDEWYAPSLVVSWFDLSAWARLRSAICIGLGLGVGGGSLEQNECFARSATPT